MNTPIRLRRVPHCPSLLVSNGLFSSLLVVAALSAGVVLNASTLYWDGTTAGWDAAANWSTSSSATTPDPASAPGSADAAVFNISTANSAVTDTISLNASQAAYSLAFLNTGTTLIQGGGTNQTLTLGAGGVTSSFGTNTIGSNTSGQNVAITLGASQTWTNTSANTLTFANGLTGAAATSVNLTIAGSGNTQFGDNTGANSTTVGIANGASGGVVSLTKTGAGTLTLLVGANASFTYTGNTTINGGTLSINNNSKAWGTSLNNSTVVMGGGTLTGSSSAARTMTFKSLTINAGASTLTPGSNTTFDFSGTGGNQGITRNVGGTVNFTANNKTAQTNTNGIIGGYATFGGNDWATSAGTGSTTGAITAYASYTNDTWASGNNTTVTTSSSVTSGSTTNSLRFAAASANTLILAGTNTITSGGVLVSNAVGANATAITGGTLQGAAGADLVVIQNNTNGAGALTIGSTITDNTSATSLTKSGAGSLVLTGTNSFTGATFVNTGTLTLSGTGAINTSSAISVTTGATFNNSGSVAVTAAMNLAEGAILAGTGAFTPSAMTVTANLSDGLTAITAGSTLTKTGTLTFSLTGITAGTYSLFSGSPSGAYTGVSIASTALNTADANATFTGTDGTWNYVFTNASNQLAITAAIPEPSTYAALMGLLVIGAVAVRRRRTS